MTELIYGYKGQTFDVYCPLYITINSQFVFNRLSGHLKNKPALLAAMAADGYTLKDGEMGAAPLEWKEHNDWKYPDDGAPPVYEQSTIAIAGTPGSFDKDTPRYFAELGEIGAMGNTTAWTTGQWVILGDDTEAYWDGTEWQIGRAP